MQENALKSLQVHLILKSGFDKLPDMMQNEILFFLGCFFVTALVVLTARYAQQYLATLVVVFGLIANLLVQKQIILFGIHATTTDVFAVGSMLGVNFLQRSQGTQTARKTVFITFAFFLLFCLISYWHLFWVPSPEDTAHTHYAHILGNMPRFFAASCLAYLISQYTDISIFSYLNQRWKKIPIGLAMLFSLSISEGVDTLLFTYAALYGLMSNITQVLLMSYAIKLAAVAAMAAGSQLLYRFSATSPPLSSSSSTQASVP